MTFSPSRSIHHPLEAMREQLFPYRPPLLALIEDVLSASVCAALIARIESEGMSQATIHRGSHHEVNTSIRNNDRLIFDDDALAAALWPRLQPAVPMRLEEAIAVGLNERFRAYRYAQGQYFAPHFDGCFVRNPLESSCVTVILYLSDGCRGGETYFNDLEYAVRPKAGMALLFEHMVRHEGREVTAGLKYALRTDVMYRQAAALR